MMLDRVYFKRGVQPKCGVQNEKNMESKIAFGQLILTKIINTIATRCQILRLKGTKILNSAGAPPRPRWGGFSQSP